MRLTVFSDYTLRVLLYLALQPGRLATIADIATAYGISRNHLMKVVNYLSSHGYIEAVRGKGGGIRLSTPARQINIGEIVRGTEADTALVECFEPATSHCRIENACALQGIFRQALEAFFASLDRYTLEDLLKPKRRLQPLLFQPKAADDG